MTSRSHGPVISRRGDQGTACSRSAIYLASPWVPPFADATCYSPALALAKVRHNPDPGRRKLSGDGNGSDPDGIPQGTVGDGATDGVVPPGEGDLAEYLADIPGKGPLVATIRTSMGDIHCELLQDKAPLTVANFIGLATGKRAWIDPKTGSKQTGRPFYDGLTFHRVIPSSECRAEIRSVWAPECLATCSRTRSTTDSR
jgi:cyclophilin type peptidyl-prolyl cis-trans isomerase/CLD